MCVPVGEFDPGRVRVGKRHVLALAVAPGDLTGAGTASAGDASELADWRADAV